MDQSEDTIKPFRRMPTGIRGLDTLLNGGFLQGGVYLIMGAPGTGKTIIANQLGFSHAAQGGRVLYVTLLAETHARMFGNLQGLKFFKQELISDSLNYVGAYHVLEKQGLDGLLRTLGEAVRKFQATQLFIDGVASAEEVASSPLVFKKFVHQLNAVLSTSRCTTFLLSSLDGSLAHPEHTMVDGIISLTTTFDGMRSRREIEIKKFRGSAHSQGLHALDISDEGVQIYPRIESYLGRLKPQQAEIDERCGFGIPRLDAMLGGGVPRASITSLLGAAGTGKTSLGAQFLLEGARRGEPGFYFGLYEPPSRLLRKLDQLGVPLSEQVRQGKVELQWQPQFEGSIDKMIQQILTTVQERKVKRLFLDGVTGLRESMFDPRRIHRVMAAMAHEFRSLGVSWLFTEETELFPRQIASSISDLSAVTDNVFFMRHIELDSELRLFLSLIKTRENQADAKIHEIFITQGGLRIGDTFPNTRALISGQPVPQPTRPKKAKKAKRSGRT